MYFCDRSIKLRVAVDECGRKNREVTGRYTDDGVLLGAQANLFADDCFIGAKTALPEIVGQHDNLVFAGNLFFRKETAAEVKVCAEEREIAVGDLYAVDVFGSAIAEERGAPCAERNDTFQRMILCAVVVDVGERKLIAGTVGGSAPKEDEAARLFEREVPEENAIGDAED